MLTSLREMGLSGYEHRHRKASDLLSARVSQRQELNGNIFVNNSKIYSLAVHVLCYNVINKR